MFASASSVVAPRFRGYRPREGLRLDLRSRSRGILVWPLFSASSPQPRPFFLPPLFFFSPHLVFEGAPFWAALSHYDAFDLHPQFP